MPEIHVDSRQVAASVGQAIENALNDAMTKAVRYDDLIQALSAEFATKDVALFILRSTNEFYVYVRGKRTRYDTDVKAVISAMYEFFHAREAADNKE